MRPDCHGRPSGDSLVPHSLDGFGGALIVVLLHVAVHGAKLHLPPKVDVHRALLHCGVDELVRRVPQLRFGIVWDGVYLKG